MAVTPKINLRDGTGTTTNLVYNTNQIVTVLTGVIDISTVSIQVSVNGAGFISDNNLIAFSGSTFSVPNLSVYPDGLPLEIGVNTILIRAVDLVGAVSATASAIITRIEDLDQTATQIPTGIKISRYRDLVKISIAKPVASSAVVEDDGGNLVLVSSNLSQFLGFNIYGSTSPAGSTGYFKLNSTIITSPSEFQQDDILTFTDTGLWDIGSSKLIRVRVSEEDKFGTETVVRLNSVHDNSLLSQQMEFKGTFRNYTMTEYLVFNHSRVITTGQLNTDQFFGMPPTDPIYYVITGVYFDSITNTEIETPYSQEVLGVPLTLDTTIRDLQGRTKRAIVEDYISAIQRVDNKISLIPLSTVRDIDIDPFASEAERIWFLLDFVHRSQSFLTLLAIDNVSGSGESDPVVSSAYKQAMKAALGLTSDALVQGLIDQQFDKLAGNVNETREAGRQATGTLLLYTETRPSKNITIPAGSFATSTANSSTGITSQRFRIAGSYVLPSTNAEAFYNFNEKRYEIRVSILADNAGLAGNVPPGSIKTLIGVTGLNAINDASTVFGRDLESNADLASRSMLKFASVDTGTGSGYLLTATSQVGVVRSKVIKSGDRLMMRDYDDVRGKHIGGKVDIWVQGLQERQVQDKFAFTFAIALNVQAKVQNTSNLVFEVLDPRVTPSTPLVEILNNSSQSLGVRNVTQGADYDLTGVTILGYNIFQVNDLIAQPITNLDDIVIVDFRYQSVNKLFMTLQPVRRVVSVVGEISGALTEGVHYQLVKNEDPLWDGESTLAKNYVEITPFGGIPSGATITVNHETHVMIGLEEESLKSIGINTATIRVFSEDRSIEFSGPSAVTPDFDLIFGTPTTPAKIVRTVGSKIVSGQTISVDYSHDENFTVTYVINQLLQQLQSVLNTKRHTTADVLVKQAVQNNINIETTVQLKKGATKDTVDPLIRNNVSLDLERKTIGEGTAQSNVDAEINDSTGVDFNVLPMAKMAYADGSIKLREIVLSTAINMGSLNSGSHLAYLLTNSLAYPTTDGGGLPTEHKGVFIDDVAMNLSSSLSLVATTSSKYQAYIIGNGGAVIVGYSDDSTLASEGFDTLQYAEERLRRTANHVVVALPSVASPTLDLPTDHEFTVTYVIRGDRGSHDITASETEVIDLGDLTITYRSGS